MNLEQLRELIQIFERSNISEVEVEEEGLRIVLKKAAPVLTHATAPVSMQTSVPQPHAPSVVTHVVQDDSGDHRPPTAWNNGKAVKDTDAPEEDTLESYLKREGLMTIDSPMVGVFYAAPAPGEDPFVSPGEAVDAAQTVCIVEAMKLMNEVAAKFPCIVERVLVENAEPVEFGQPLFAVRPTGRG